MIVRGRYFAKVLRVIDGDTIIVEFSCPVCCMKSEQRVRLARIDAPELDGPRNPQAAWSKQHLDEMIGGKVVELSICQKWPDRYGRVISEVIIDGVNVSNQMVADGCAKWYTRYGKALHGDVVD